MKRGFLDLPVDIPEHLRDAARITVASRATGPDDESQLLEMLGIEQLSEQQRRYKATRRKPVPMHCKNGHRMTPANTKYRDRGRVYCRTCENTYRKNLRSK